MAANPSRCSPECREIEFLVDQLERSFHGGAWHGPAVLESLEGVDAEIARRHPIANAHSIGEIVLHLAAWIDVTRRRIEGEPVHGLPDVEDWPDCGCADEAEWRRLCGTLEASHAALQRTLRALTSDARLDDLVAGSDPTVRSSLSGLVQHNVYHAGQIVLLKKAAGAAS